MPDPDPNGLGSLGAPPMRSNSLDRSAIVATIASARTKLLACGDQLVVGGTLRVKVNLAPSGKVASATADGIDDVTLRTCVVKVVKTLRFPKSDDGGAFNYPLAFHGVDLTDTLDAMVIEQGLAKLEAKLAACHKEGKVTAIRPQASKLDVDATGKVTKVWTYAPSGDRKADACVERVFKVARFGKTANGGSFVYPRPIDINATIPGPTPPTAPAVDPYASNTKLPDSGDLDRAAISDAVAKIRSSIDACGAKSKVGGTVKVEVRVAPDGSVTSATANGSADAALDGCVANVMKTATFAKTKNGGAFSYPFVLGTPTSGDPVHGPLPTPPPNNPPTSPAAGPPDALDRAMISDGINRAKDAIAKCGDGKTKGLVKVSVVVAPSGTVTSAKVTQTPGDALGTCVAGVILKATFAKTAQGGSFSYPFVF